MLSIPVHVFNHPLRGELSLQDTHSWFRCNIRSGNQCLPSSTMHQGISNGVHQIMQKHLTRNDGFADQCGPSRPITAAMDGGSEIPVSVPWLTTHLFMDFFRRGLKEKFSPWISWLEYHFRRTMGYYGLLFVALQLKNVQNFRKHWLLFGKTDARTAVSCSHSLRSIFTNYIKLIQITSSLI